MCENFLAPEEIHATAKFHRSDEIKPMQVSKIWTCPADKLKIFL